MSDTRFYEQAAWKYWDKSVKATPFALSVVLVRPANTTAYAVGDLVNSGPVVACATTDTSVTITPASLNGIAVGQAVTGTGIAASTKVATVGTTTVTLDKAATATAAAESLTFTSTAVLPVLDFSALGAVAGQFVEIRSAILTSSYGAAALKLNAQIEFYKATLLQADQSDNTAFAPAYATHTANKTARLDDISSAVGLGTNAYEVLQADVSRIAELGTGAKLYAAVLANNAYTPASGETITLTVKGILH